MTRPAPSPTTSAVATDTAESISLATPATPMCAAPQRWSQTQADLTLFLCFEPHPPQLGVPVTSEAVLVAADGQPLSDATVELTMVGGMAGMLGEHDEDFTLTLTSQGAGRYTAQASIGPTDLMLTEIRVTVRHGRQVRTFSALAADLPPP